MDGSQNTCVVDTKLNIHVMQENLRQNYIEFLANIYILLIIKLRACFEQEKVTFFHATRRIQCCGRLIKI